MNTFFLFTLLFANSLHFTDSVSSSTTQQQLTDALKKAFGGNSIFSIGNGLPRSSTEAATTLDRDGAGSKYIVEVSPNGLDTWSDEQVKTEQERSDILPRLMTTPDGTQFRCAIPIPKIFLPPSPTTASTQEEIKTPPKPNMEYCQAKDLSVGTKMQARFKTKGAYYPGKVSKMNADGTYNIQFDDGDIRNNTPLNEMIMDKRKKNAKKPIIPIKDMTKLQRNQIVKNAALLLKPLNDVCFRKVEGWWTYEVCKNQKVRQYHTENQPDPNNKDQFLQIEVNSYILGKYDSTISNDPPDDLQQKNPNKKKKDGTTTTTTTGATAAAAELVRENIRKKKKPTASSSSSSHPLTYNIDITNTRPISLVQTFKWGTPCDLTHEPRETTIEFSCGSSSKYNTYIDDIQEIATCKYHVKIKTPLLCKHDDFKDPIVEKLKNIHGSEANIETIKCHPLISQNVQETPIQFVTPEDLETTAETEVLASGMLDADTIQKLLEAQGVTGSIDATNVIQLEMTDDMNAESVLEAVRKMLGDDVESIVIPLEEEEDK